MNKNTIIFGGGCFWCTEAVFKMLKGVISVEPGYAGGSTENPTYQNVCSGNTGHAEVIKIEYDSEIISLENLLTVFFTTHDPTIPMTKSSRTHDPDKIEDSRSNRNIIGAKNRSRSQNNRGSSYEFNNLNSSGQGNDIGEQYRSIILYLSEEQKNISEKFIQKLNNSFTNQPPPFRATGVPVGPARELINERSAPIMTEIKKLDVFYPAENYHKNYYENNKNQPYCQVVINPKLKKVQEKFAELLKK